MSDFLSNFDDRKAEIDKYFNFIEFLENYTMKKGIKLEYTTEEKPVSTRIDAQQKQVLRANCYLMLYNLVEGTIIEGLDAIFERISAQNVDFQYLTDIYKKIWLNYQQSLVKIIPVRPKESNPVNRSLPDVLANLKYFKVLEFTEKGGTEDIPPTKHNDYRAYLKVIKSTEISGNIDAFKIRELAKSYDFYQKASNSAPLEAILIQLAEKYNYTAEDIEIDWQNKRRELLELKCDDLLKIKRMRNQLAHGEIIFSDAGNKDSITELIGIKENICIYLEFILLNINDFIENNRFKLSVPI